MIFMALPEKKNQPNPEEVSRIFACTEEIGIPIIYLYQAKQKKT